MFIKEMSPEDELMVRMTESADRCDKVWFSKNVYGWVEVSQATVKQEGEDVFMWLKGRPFAVIVNQTRNFPKVSIFHIESALQMPFYIDKGFVAEIEKLGRPVRMNRYAATVSIVMA